LRDGKAAQTLAVTGQGSIQLAMLASVPLIIGGAMFGFARGRRASRLDG